MKLKYNRQISDSVVTVVLMLTGITTRERRALKTLGYPPVVYSEVFDVSGTTIDIDIPLNEFNNLGAFTFAGSVEDIPMVLDEVADFIRGIHEVLQETVSNTMISYAEIEPIANTVIGEIEVADGVCHTGNSCCGSSHIR